jgi:hypothetical protein
MLAASRSGFLHSILTGWNPKSIKHTFYPILKQGAGEFHILFESLLEKMIQGPHLDMCSPPPPLNTRKSSALPTGRIFGRIAQKGPVKNMCG